MNKQIRLIALDLDGTLLVNKKISEKNIQTLRSCIEKGIQVVLVTGRPYCFTKMLARKIDESVGVIAANGAIYEIGTHYMEKTLDNAVIPVLVDILKKYPSAHAFFKGKHEFYTHEPYDDRFLYDHMNDIFSEESRVHSNVNLSFDELKKQTKDILKILVYDFNEQMLSELRKEIECVVNICVTDYQKISFDVNAAKVDKGVAIDEVLQKLHIDHSQVMAFGDGNNDIPMFQRAGMSVAMGNASDEVKAYCDFITDDYREDGVANAIMKFILHS